MFLGKYCKKDVSMAFQVYRSDIRLLAQEIRKIRNRIRCDKKFKISVISDGSILIDRSLLAKMSGFNKSSALLKSMNCARTPCHRGCRVSLTHFSATLLR